MASGHPARGFSDSTGFWVQASKGCGVLALGFWALGSGRLSLKFRDLSCQWVSVQDFWSRGFGFQKFRFVGAGPPGVEGSGANLCCIVATHLDTKPLSIVTGRIYRMINNMDISTFTTQT